MAKLGKIRASKERLSQTINLKDLFGKNFSNQSAIKEAFAQAVIDRIVERTEGGKAVGGKRNLKAPYSKEYVESLEFKAAGKSKGRVNMTLTGDMLRSIDVLDVGANTITIGIDDPDESPKAFNHQVGDTVPRRDFFGINNTELTELAQEFRPDINRAFKERGDNRKTLLEAFAERFLSETASGQNED